MTSAVPQRVLVTGAAGLIGRAVLADLADRGVSATALVLAAADDLPASRIVVGDAGDPEIVRSALDGVDAVVHLAAIPAPHLDTAQAVFTRNTRATFAVLEEAGRAGVRRAVIASSFSVTGLPWADVDLHPAYVPVDERLPLQVTDPYALGKQADEATAEMMARRHGAASSRSGCRSSDSTTTGWPTGPPSSRGTRAPAPGICGATSTYATPRGPAGSGSPGPVRERTCSSSPPTTSSPRSRPPNCSTGTTPTCPGGGAARPVLGDRHPGRPGRAGLRTGTPVRGRSGTPVLSRLPPPPPPPPPRRRLIGVPARAEEDR